MPPSIENRAPYGLLSLWDIMLQNAGFDFGLALSRLAEVERIAACQRLINLDVDIVLPSEELHRQACRALHDVVRACAIAGMNGVQREIDRFTSFLEVPISIENIQQKTKHLRERLLDDLGSEYYLQLASGDVRFYNVSSGDLILTKFGSEFAQDIEHSGNCLALREPTACIFHLMRAIERAVQSVTAKLTGISSTKEWGKLLSDIDRAIEAMDKGPERN
jgi:hypothetical protein